MSPWDLAVERGLRFSFPFDIAVKLFKDVYLHVLVKTDLIIEGTRSDPFPFSAFSNGLNDRCNQAEWAVNNLKDGIRIGEEKKTNKPEMENLAPEKYMPSAQWE